MIARALVVVFGTILLMNAAFSAHIITVTRQNLVLTKRTDTYANSSGDLPVEERAYGSKSWSIDAAGDR